MFWKTVKIFTSHCYDNIGRCIGINLLWFAVSVFSLGILLPPATAALFCYTNQLVRFQDPDVRTFFRSMRRFLFRAWGLFLLEMIVFTGLGWGMFIYLTQFSQVIGQTASTILATASFWIFAYFAVIQIYAWVFLVHQDIGVFAALKRATFLFLMKPVFTLLLFLLVLVLAGLNIPLRLVPLAFIQPIATAVLLNAGVLVALDEYED